MAFMKAAFSAGRKPVAAPMRVTCPVPAAIRPAAFSGENWSWSTRAVDQTQPSWATFSCRVMRSSRSSTRFSTGLEASR
jgi:hypothetical protein